MKENETVICPVCREPTNEDDMVQARYDICARVCPDCRGDGN